MKAARFWALACTMLPMMMVAAPMNMPTLLPRKSLAGPAMKDETRLPMLGLCELRTVLCQVSLREYSKHDASAGCLCPAYQHWTQPQCHPATLTPSVKENPKYSLYCRYELMLLIKLPSYPLIAVRTSGLHPQNAPNRTHSPAFSVAINTQKYNYPRISLTPPHQPPPAEPT